MAVSYAVTYTAVAITCDTVPISDRPTDGWAVQGEYSKSDFLVALG